MPHQVNNEYDVIVIGGGQSGLAVGYYLRRSGLSYVILDKEEHPGGSWQHYWKSLRLFSPAQWSSLPGVMMPGGGDYYPTREETIHYIADYEKKYALSVRRPVIVTAVTAQNNNFLVDTDHGRYISRAVVSATGSFTNPVIPHYPGEADFQGEVIHSAAYSLAEAYAGKRVAIVGEGNSGAQILAEVSQVADTIWITQKEPRFLPDHVDGRYLFDAATQMYEAKKQGKAYTPPSLGDVVMVPPVKDARARGVLDHSLRPFSHYTPHGLAWDDGREEEVDAIIFCTGFRPSLEYLAPLHVVNADGRADTIETRSTKVPGLWFTGYGNWTGFASATLIGVGRSARQTVSEIETWLNRSDK